MTDHEKEINSFITEAEFIANRRARQKRKKSEKRIGKDGEPYVHWFQTEFFHEEMNRMTKEAGLRK